MRFAGETVRKVLNEQHCELLALSDPSDLHPCPTFHGPSPFLSVPQQEVLEAMGLYAAPPQCEVTVPYNPESLLEVSDKELMAVYHESVPRAGGGAGSQRSSPIGRSPTQSPRVSPRTALPPAPVPGPASPLTVAAIAEAAAASAVPAGEKPYITSAREPLGYNRLRGCDQPAMIILECCTVLCVVCCLHVPTCIPRFSSSLCL